MAAALRVAIASDFGLRSQAIDGDYEAQDELGEECDCDPDVFDMLGEMINGNCVPDTCLCISADRQQVLGDRTGAIFFAETDAKRYRLAELFAGCVFVT